MAINPTAIVSWSSGKDSAWALQRVREAGDLVVVALMTATNSANGRASMHGSAGEIVQAQADAVGVPLITVPMPSPCTNGEYEEATLAALAAARSSFGATHIVYGDLFLKDVRAYRERLCARAGIAPHFPLWSEPTDRLAATMIDSGLSAIIGCVDTQRLPESFVGRVFDAELVADLPAGVDPCAENGEFHTVAVDGPMFRTALQVAMHGIVRRERFVYADLRLAGGPSCR